MVGRESKAENGISVLLIVFDRPPPKKEASGLQVTLEKIVGGGGPKENRHFSLA